MKCIVCIDLRRHHDACQDTPDNTASDTAGGSKPQEAAQDAASAVTSAVPDAPKEAAKDILNPLQNFFGEPADSPSFKIAHALAGVPLLLCPATTSLAGSCLDPSYAPKDGLIRQVAQISPWTCLAAWSPQRG